MNEFLEFLQILLSAIVTAAVPVLTTYLVKYLSGVFKKVKVETEQTVVNNTIAEVLDTVLSVVTSTSQTYVDSLKESGKFDEEAQKIAFQTTKDTILTLLSEEAKELIKTLYTDLDEWLRVQIEASVKSIKNN